MSGSCSYRWLLAVFVLAALPAAPQSTFASSDRPSPAEGAFASNLPANIPVTERAGAPLPKLSPEELADIYEVRQHYQAAIETYNKVEDPSANVWNKLGIAYQMMYNLKDAAHCYKESLKLNPENADVLNNLATVQDGMNDFTAGERNYRRSLKLNPNSAVVFKNLGTNLLMQHKYDEGAQAYKQAVALDPNIFESRFGPKVNDPAPLTEHGTAAYFKARSCARAGNSTCALDFLNRAFDEGSATLKKVAEEADFESLRGTAALARLLANQQ